MLKSLEEQIPDIELGRKHLKHKKALTPQVKQYASLNYREILNQCLEWKSIDDFNVEQPENGAREYEKLAETSLLDKYDYFCVATPT